MPLINCPDCDNRVSDQADVCRHCGRPIKNAIRNTRSEEGEMEFEFFDHSEAAALKKRVAQNETRINIKNELLIEKKQKQHRSAQALRKVWKYLFFIAIGVGFYYYRQMK